MSIMNRLIMIQEFLDFAGQGVNVYIMDTGIRTTHVYFQRGGAAVNFKGKTITPYCENDEPMVRAFILLHGLLAYQALERC
jgi:hypothetical protein